MFGVEQGQIGYIVGAEERVERLSLSDNSQKLSTAHEQVLRKAPKPLQDKIAKMVLTRLDDDEKRTVSVKSTSSPDRPRRTLKDICDVLEIGNVAHRLDDDEKKLVSMNRTADTQSRQILFVSGVYAITFVAFGDDVQGDEHHGH